MRLRMYQRKEKKFLESPKILFWKNVPLKTFFFGNSPGDTNLPCVQLFINNSQAAPENDLGLGVLMCVNEVVKNEHSCVCMKL